MPKRMDLTGRQFGRWTVLEYAGYSNGVMWLCQCECGKRKEIRSDRLRYGRSTSCGCYRTEVTLKETIKKNTKHGMYNTRLYHIWQGMKQRCSRTCPEHEYNNYYGRGIRVCLEWENDFETFMKWAIDNGYGEGLTIDRIDVNGNYEPKNCQWASPIEQARNKRNTLMIKYRGEERSLPEWAEILGVNYSTLGARLRRGMSVEEAFNKK